MIHRLLKYLLSFYSPVRGTHTRAFSPEPLTNRDRQDLVSIKESPGYNVVLKLMEGECESFVTELLNTNPASEAEVIAKHRMAKMAWSFFIRFQKRIEFEVNEAVILNSGHTVSDIDLDDPDVIGRLVNPLAINT